MALHVHVFDVRHRRRQAPPEGGWNQERRHAGGNGSGTAATKRVHFHQDGRVDFEKSADGVITYREYTDGQITKLVEDADTTSLSPPTGVPARSDTALRTSYSYNDDGTLEEITDPKGLVTRYEYDDGRRRTATIRNYVNGVPSGTTGDDDVFTRMAYTDGLRTKLWVDFDGDGTEDTGDQVTEYTYGTTKGASAGDSEIGSGHLLQEVKYPDSANASDVVTYAYNAQGQRVYVKDQAGNVIETDHDDGGRETDRRITTLAGGFDGAVRRISTTYTSRGQRELVTQYDAATGGSVLDEVKFTYDDWNEVEKFEQDRNSTVSATGSVDDYQVTYTWKKATSGRNTIRLGSMSPPRQRADRLRLQIRRRPPRRRSEPGNPHQGRHDPDRDLQVQRRRRARGHQVPRARGQVAPVRNDVG